MSIEKLFPLLKNSSFVPTFSELNLCSQIASLLLQQVVLVSEGHTFAKPLLPRPHLPGIVLPRAAFK
jgi:hypothetical protein